MGLGFPSHTRRYDATRPAVQFWEHDKSMEFSSYVTLEPLKKIDPNVRTEAADICGCSIPIATVFIAMDV